MRTNLAQWLVFGLLATLSLHAGPKADPKWEGEIKGLEKADQAAGGAKNSVVFVGSSSIRKWTTLVADFPKTKVVNHGFGGSQIVDSTAYADRIIFPNTPTKIVLYAGDNDIAAGKSADQVAADFKEFVETVRAKLPGTPIFFISIKPSPSRWQLAEKVRKTNALIQERIRAGKQLSYINVFDAMLGADGKPDSTLFVEDNLHMNSKGYALWTKIVGKALGVEEGR